MSYRDGLLKTFDFHRFFHRCGKLTWAQKGSVEGRRIYHDGPKTHNHELTPLQIVRYDPCFPRTLPAQPGVTEEPGEPGAQ